MTCASPFTTYSTPLLFEFFQPGLEIDQLSGLMGLLCVVVFGDAHDNVHHIRYAARTFGATIELRIDFGRHDKLPRIGLEKVQDDVLDLLGGDHIALTDK